MGIIINDVTRLNEYNASQGQTFFSGTFPILSETDVLVYKRGENESPDDNLQLLELETDYTVSDVGEESGFYIELKQGCNLNDFIVLAGKSPIERKSYYTTTFSADGINNDLENQTIFSKWNETVSDKKTPKYKFTEKIDNSDLVLPKLKPNEVWVKSHDDSKIETTEIINDESGFLKSLNELDKTGVLIKKDMETADAREITGTLNQISISNGDGVNGNPVISLSNNTVIPGNGALAVPSGSTSQRPSTSVNGMIRYDSDFHNVQIYEDGAWWDILTPNSGAPINAKYILKESHSGLPYAQSIGLLSNGIVKNSTSSGIGTLSIASIGTDYITKVEDDASPKLSNNLDANSKKIQNLATPLDDTDAVNKAYLGTFLSDYAKLSGRSGGQTLAGGTEFGDNLTFLTTTDAGIKGNYLFPDIKHEGDGFSYITINTDGALTKLTSNVVIVTSYFDFGTPVAGKINLKDNTIYDLQHNNIACPYKLVPPTDGRVFIRDGVILNVSGDYLFENTNLGANAYFMLIAVDIVLATTNSKIFNIDSSVTGARIFCHYTNFVGTGQTNSIGTVKNISTFFSYGVAGIDLNGGLNLQNLQSIGFNSCSFNGLNTSNTIFVNISGNNGILSVLNVDCFPKPNESFLNIDSAATFISGTVAICQISLNDKKVVTFDNTTNTITLVNNFLTNGNILKFINSGGALPTGLNDYDSYYVINSSGDTFKVSLSLGGSEVDFTTNGSGTNYIIAPGKSLYTESQNQSALNLIFNGNTYIPDSTAKAYLACVGNTIPTDLPALNTPVKINSTIFSDVTGKERFTTFMDGTCTYIGLEDITIKVHVNASSQPASGIDQLFTIYIGITRSKKFIVTYTNATNTVNRVAHGLSNGTTIRLLSTSLLPTGLRLDIFYYVINATGNTFQLSYTLGGTAIDFTTDGSGTNYYRLGGIREPSASSANTSSGGKPQDTISTDSVDIKTGDIVEAFITNVSANLNDIISNRIQIMVNKL